MRWTNTVLEGSPGVINMRGRMYDPDWGSFLTMDPIATLGTQTLTPYAYVGNSPHSFVDPSGFLPVTAPPGSDETSTAIHS